MMWGGLKMSFDARQDSVGKLLNDSIYRIPRNQRPYVWTDRNWIDLFRDFQLISDGTMMSSHFLGSIVLKREEDEAGLTVYTVIDGQQRILTLTILLASIIFVLKKRDMVSDAAGTRKYVVATDNKGIERVIVDPEHHRSLPRIIQGVINADTDSFKTMSPTAFVNANRVPSNKDELIVKAFKYFVGELGHMSDRSLLSFRDAVVATQYVNISSTTEEDLYTIFEILNARGLPLEDSDLLKNYIMRYIQPESRRDDAKTVWLEIEQTIGNNMNAFLRHYAIQCCRFSSTDKEGVYRKIRDYSDSHKTQELLDDIRCKADYYARIMNPKTDSYEGTILSFFKSHNVRVFRPLLLSLMHRLDVEDITQQEYDDSLNFIYKFYICYKTVGGLESSQIIDLITKYAFAVEKTFKQDETLRSWRSSFVSKLPSAESFAKRFAALGWSHSFQLYKGNKNKDQCKVILELLEFQKAKGRPLGGYTIEHVLPDSAGDGNASIGNLLLLESDLNRRCKDLALADKLVIYRESSFATTRGFAERYSTKQFVVEARTEYLAHYVYELIVK